MKLKVTYYVDKLVTRCRKYRLEILEKKKMPF